jgi:hypothetical protein
MTTDNNSALQTRAKSGKSTPAARAATGTTTNNNSASRTRARSGNSTPAARAAIVITY